jgi:hypothetical protein
MLGKLSQIIICWGFDDDSRKQNNNFVHNRLVQFYEDFFSTGGVLSMEY